MFDVTSELCNALTGKVLVIFVEGVLSVAHIAVSDHVHIIGGFHETVNQHICILNDLISFILSRSNFTNNNLN